MFQVTRQELAFEPERKIIRGEEYLACVESQGLVDAGRQEAERIIAAAQEEFQRQRQQGYEQGVREGQQQIALKMLETVDQAVEYLSQLEEQVVDLVFNALQKVVGEMEERDLVVKVVRHALAVVRTQPQVTVRVSPRDVETVRSRLSEILSGYPGINYLEVAADARLATGGCVLETELGVVEASIDVQLDTIRNALLKSISVKQA